MHIQVEKVSLGRLFAIYILPEKYKLQLSLRGIGICFALMSWSVEHMKEAKVRLHEAR